LTCARLRGTGGFSPRSGSLLGTRALAYLTSLGHGVLAGLRAILALLQRLDGPRFALHDVRRLADAITALNAAHASVKDGVAALRATETKVGPVIRAYTSFLRATFSTATAQLGDFGLQAPKAHQPLPTAKRVAATAKLRATRTARGTTSKKQKLAIKGDVTGVTVTPITTPAPASPPAAPAGPAPVATTPVAAPKWGHHPGGALLVRTSPRAAGRGTPWFFVPAPRRCGTCRSRVERYA
jgi:hypothetical protein